MAVVKIRVHLSPRLRDRIGTEGRAGRMDPHYNVQRPHSAWLDARLMRRIMTRRCHWGRNSPPAGPNGQQQRRQKGSMTTNGYSLSKPKNCPNGRDHLCNFKRFWCNSPWSLVVVLACIAWFPRGVLSGA